MIVSLAGLDLSQTDADGWVVERLSDWWDLPESKSAVVSKPVADGVFSSRRRDRHAVYPSLLIRWKGRSEAAASEALRELRRLVSRADVPLMVDDGAGALTRMVEVRTVDVSPAFEWWNLPVTIDTIARDPAMYGPSSCASTGLPVSGSGWQFPLGPDSATGFFDFGTAGTPGQVTVSNEGTSDAFPSITVTGELLSGFEVVEVESGFRARLEWPVIAGSSVAVDVRSSRATVDGSGDVSAFLSLSGRFRVPAGGSRTYQFGSLGASGGSPLLQVCVAPAYL